MAERLGSILPDPKPVERLLEMEGVVKRRLGEQASELVLEMKNYKPIPIKTINQ